MKSPVLFHVLCIVAGVCLVSCQTTETDSSQELSESQQIMVSELDSLISGIGSNPLNIYDQDLKPLDFLGNARIVGLGEATHGTSEFYSMKHRVFRYLVEHHGFRAIAIEADFGESVYLDRYITTGEGDLGSLMREKMYFWTYRNQETYEMLQWMRAYNTGKPRSEMIRYFGLDCQYYNCQEDLLREYLGKVDPEYLNTILPLFEDIRNSLDWDDYEVMSIERYEHFKKKFEDFCSDFEKNHHRWAAVLTEEDFEIHKRVVKTLLQIHKFRFFGSADIPYSYEGGPTRYYRDLFMADNALWIRDLMGKNAKIALWAHNGHVSKDPVHFGPTIYGDQWGSMGFYLGDALGTEYQAVGFSFSTGSFVAAARSTSLGIQTIYSLPMPASVNFIFHHAVHKNFILPFHRLQPQMEISGWLSEKRHFISIGALWLPDNMYERVVVPELYDVIIHFDHTSAASQL